MPDRVQPVKSANLPTPVGPYSPAMIFGNLVFVSGQAGRDPATGALAPDVETQAEQTLKNIAAILKAAGSDLQHVLRCGVFLVDMTRRNAVKQQSSSHHARTHRHHRR